VVGECCVGTSAGRHMKTAGSVCIRKPPLLHPAHWMYQPGTRTCRASTTFCVAATLSGGGCTSAPKLPSPAELASWLSRA
jgi:hypothetical protein